jgi:hypothetical protein
MSDPLEGAGARIPRVREAALRAVARVRGETEPTAAECAAARWEGGLAAAYRSLPGQGRAAEKATAAAPPAPRYRPPLRWVPVVAAGAFALALALSPATALWETRGHAPPAHALGVPNPPENPLALVLARVWGLLLAPVAPPDVGLTLFALASSAAVASVSFLLVHRACWGLAGAAPWILPGALLVALPVAVPLSTLGLGSGKEAAYPLLGAALLSAGWLAARGRDRTPDAASLRCLLGAGYLSVLALTSGVLWLTPLACAALFAVRIGVLAPSRPGSSTAPGG